MKHALQAFTRSCISFPLHLSPLICELSMASRSLERKIYQSELRTLGKGIPLYDPIPTGEHHVHIGDVGYQRNGKFRPVSNVLQSAEGPQSFNRTYGVPDGFNPLALNCT